MSALSSGADVTQSPRHVSFVPTADMLRASDREQLTWARHSEMRSRASPQFACLTVVVGHLRLEEVLMPLLERCHRVMARSFALLEARRSKGTPSASVVVGQAGQVNVDCTVKTEIER